MTLTEVLDANAVASKSDGAKLPLIVDADAALFGGGLVVQAVFANLGVRPFDALKTIALTLKGWPHRDSWRWRELGLDPSTLPLDQRVVSIMRLAVDQGRPVYLCMSEPRPHLPALVSRLPDVDEIITGGAETPLVGRQRAEVLAERFPHGFDYVGCSDADRPVWQCSRSAINAGTKTFADTDVASGSDNIETLPRKSWGPGLIRAMRPRQWVKNLLVFAPIVLGGALGHLPALYATFAAFLAMSLVASSTYLINDMLDAQNDRKHWSKRDRPLASGELPFDKALWTASAGLGLGFGIAALIGENAVACLGAYVVLTLCYSLYVKRVPLLDGVVLAILYTMRFALGIAACGVPTSPWLFVVSMFAFTSLCYAKRYTELDRLKAVSGLEIHGRGYKREDLPLLLAFGVAAGIAAVIVVIFYILDDAFRRSFHGNSIWLWSFPLLLFVSNCRIWLVTVRGEMNDDPIDFALRDRISQIVLATLIVCFGFAWLG